MLNITDKIMAGESTGSVALVKFGGTGRWEMLAYAYIANNSSGEVDLKLVDAFR